MPDYTKPTLFTTGQVLGRGHLETLRDNDDFFWGMAHAWQPVVGNLNSTTAGQALFDGWHYYKTDATKLDFYVTLNAGGGTLYLYYDYGGIHEQRTVVDAGTAGTVTSDVRGLYDIAAEDSTPRPEGLYRVYCYASGGTGYCRPPFTVYTGSEHYGLPPTPVDLVTSSASFFNRVRSNDIYFNDCLHIQPAFSGMQRSGASKNCWDGWTYHRGTRLYYRITLPSNWGGGDSFSLQYDYGGANQQELLSWTMAGTREDYVDISTDGYTYTPGQRYRVTARVNSGRLPNVEYLYIEPQTTDVGPGLGQASWDYVIMDDFVVNQTVRGSGPLGDKTLLSLLGTADRHIFSALCTSSKVGRRDYAVRKPTVTIDAVAYTGDLRLVRRYDTLVYRTLSGEVSWGTSTESLSDYTADDAYMTLDLRGLDLAYGQVYKITGEPVEFAAEIP